MYGADSLIISEIHSDDKLMKKIAVIALMVAIKKTIDDSDKVWNSIKNGIHNIFYSKITLFDDDLLYTHHDQVYFAFREEMSTICIPIYYNKDSISLIWYFHGDLLQKMRNYAMDYERKQIKIQEILLNEIEHKLMERDEIEEEYIDESASEEYSYTDQIVLKKTYMKLNPKTLKYEERNASTLFPSTNYLNLNEIIKKHNYVSNLVGSYSVLGILIDGVPGLGKTKYADFAACNGIANDIYKIDMTSLLEQSFMTILQTIYHDITIKDNTIFLIDDIDKYVNYRVRKQYDEVQRNETVQKESFDEYCQITKNIFLYNMISILDRDGLNHPLTVIFCSDDFQSVFGDAMLLRYKSIKERFVSIKFNQCDHNEIIKYVMYYNDKLYGTQFHKNLLNVDLHNLLRKDVEITHRILNHISVEHEYDAIAIINAINARNKQEEDDVKALNTFTSKYIILDEYTKINPYEI